MTAVVAGRVCALGCDVSRWQGGINYNVFNLDFVIYKATGGDGGLYIDPKFKENAAGFHTVEGAYHFASKCAYDPVQEADFFCNALLSSDWANMPSDKKLPPTLDWEPTGGKIPNSAAWCLKFLKRCQERTGLRPFIYTAGWCNPIGSDADMAELKTYDFWLASYTSNPDQYPCPPWGTDWTAWQYSSTGSVTGIAGNCDMDAFRLDRFTAILGGTPAPQPEEDIMASLDDLKNALAAASPPWVAGVWMATHSVEGNVYFVSNGVKRLIPNPTVYQQLLTAFGQTANRGIQDPVLDALPTGKWDETK